MLVRWEILEDQGALVEAQLWSSEESRSGKSSKLVLFCPGFPGMGACVFEQRHAGAMVAAGYDVAVLRHNGTRLDMPSAPAMVNNAERLQRARREGARYIGGAPGTMEGWLREPFVALVALHDRYDEIAVIGNSFGALAALWSMGLPGARIGKVTHLLLLAGAQGVLEDEGLTDVMRIWRPEFMTMPRITEKVSLNDPVEMVATLQAVYRELVARARALPEAVDLAAIVVARDELLRLTDTEKFFAAAGRGRIIVDDLDQAHPDLGLIAHDMPDYPTGKILEIFN